jgi:hypothetical protein
MLADYLLLARLKGSNTIIGIAWKGSVNTPDW